MMTQTKAQAAKARAQEGYLCVPINRNHNTLTCSACGRSWWFDHGSAWKIRCAKDKALTDVPELAYALEEAAQLIIDIRKDGSRLGAEIHWRRIMEFVAAYYGREGGA